MNLYRLLTLTLVTAGLVCFSGCKTRLDFSRAAAYQSSVRVDEAVLISLPQSIAKREYKIKLGTLWEGQIYLIPVMDAYKNETAARMKGVFTGGVTVITDEALAQLRQADPETGVANEPASRDLEAILSELGESEKLKRGDIEEEDIEDEEKAKKLKAKKKQEELTQEALRASSLEMMEQRDYGYILEFADAQLGVVDKRFLVSYRIRLTDYDTGEELLNKRYQARSRVIDARKNQKSNERLIVDLVKEAFSGSMNQMMDDMVTVTAMR